MFARSEKAGWRKRAEFKKIFMDEWTGKLFKDKFKLLKDALQHTVPGVLEELAKLNES